MISAYVMCPGSLLSDYTFSRLYVYYNKSYLLTFLDYLGYILLSVYHEGLDQGSNNYHIIFLFHPGVTVDKPQYGIVRY